MYRVGWKDDKWFGKAPWAGCHGRIQAFEGYGHVSDNAGITDLLDDEMMVFLGPFLEYSHRTCWASAEYKRICCEEMVSRNLNGWNRFVQ